MSDEADRDPYRALFQGNPRPMFVFDRDTLEFLEVNAAACAHYGWSRDEFLAMTIRDIRPPEELPLLERALQQAREAFEGRPWKRTWHHLTRSGRVIDVHLEISRIPFRGRPASLVIVTDVTGVDQVQESLRRTEANFQAVIERSPTAMLVHRAGRFVYVNPAAVAMLGYTTAAELVGRPVLEVIHPDDRATIAALVPMPSSEPPGPLTEARMLRRDGSTVVVEGESVHIMFDGEPSKVVLVRDITERRELFARIALADRMVSVGTLAAGVAHEINNPLSFIVSNLALLERELRRLAEGTGAPRSSPDLHMILADAQEGAARVSAIVRELRALSRVDDETRGPVDVCAVLASSIRMAHNELRHRARIVHTCPERLPLVHANASRLGQVFLNLLLNAVQAIPDGRAEANEIRVRASASEDGRHVIVEVEDTGAGIPASILGRIFDPFFTTKPIGVGTGLGLAICHQIVRSLDGDIAVTSAPGQGSTFRVALPAAPGAVVPVAAPAPPPAQTSASRILMVDDEPAVGRVVQQLLAPEHEVVPVATGREALARLSAGDHFDVILCDLMMPEMSGMEFHAHLAREAPQYLDRVVFMTGGAFTPQAREFLAAIGPRRLDKPFTETELRRSLQRVRP